jgi:hypothetical protein
MIEVRDHVSSSAYILEDMYNFLIYIHLMRKAWMIERTTEYVKDKTDRVLIITIFVGKKEMIRK